LRVSQPSAELLQRNDDGFQLGAFAPQRLSALGVIPQVRLL